MRSRIPRGQIHCGGIHDTGCPVDRAAAGPRACGVRPESLGTAHRAHASTAVIAKFFPTNKLFGYVMQAEIDSVGKVVVQAIGELSQLDADTLRRRRQAKFLAMGKKGL